MWLFRKKVPEHPVIKVKQSTIRDFVYVEGILLCALYHDSRGRRLELRDRHGIGFDETRITYEDNKFAVTDIRTRIENVGIAYFLHLLRTTNSRHASEILFSIADSNLCANCPHKKWHEEYEEEQKQKNAYYKGNLSILVHGNCRPAEETHAVDKTGYPPQRQHFSSGLLLKGKKKRNQTDPRKERKVDRRERKGEQDA